MLILESPWRAPVNPRNSGLVFYAPLDGSPKIDKGPTEIALTSTAVPRFYSEFPGTTYYFSGAANNDVRGTPSGEILTSTAATISAFVYAESIPTAYVAIYSLWGITDSSAHRQILLKSDGTLAPYFKATSSVTYDGAGTIALSTRRLYHVAHTYDATNGLVGYVNGIVDATASASGALQAVTGTLTIRIGSDSYSEGREFKGSIFDVRVYNYALTAGEIMQISESRPRWNRILIPITTATGYTHPTLSLATATEITSTTARGRVTATAA